MKKWLDRYDKGGPTGKKLSQAEIANIRNFVANNADVNDINDPRYYMGRPPVNKSYNVTNRLSASNLPRYVDPNVKNDPSLKWVNAAAMLGPIGVFAAPQIAGAASVISPYLTAPAVVAGTELAGVTPASIAAAYFAHEGYKKLPQTQASVVNAYRNPTTRNIISATNDVGWNTMDFLGLGEASKLVGEIANPISKLPEYYNKLKPVNSINFSDYLTPKEAAVARARRMLAQESKWKVNNPENLKDKFENISNNFDEVYSYEVNKNPSALGTNSDKAYVFKDNGLSSANQARIAAHETGHFYRNMPDEANEWNSFFDFSKLKSSTRKYLEGKSSAAEPINTESKAEGVIKLEKGVPHGDEIRERAAQLKDYIAKKNGIPLDEDFVVTEKDLDDAIKNYVKDTNLDNTMSEMLSSLIDKKGFLNAMNKRPLAIIPAAISGKAIYDGYAEGGESMNPGWLDRYAKGGPANNFTMQSAQQYIPKVQLDNLRIPVQQEPLSFMQQWLNSPMHEQMLLNSLTKDGFYNNPDRVTKNLTNMRKKGLGKAFVKYYNKRPDGVGITTGGDANSNTHEIRIFNNNPDIVKGIITHEKSHISDLGGRLMPFSDVELIKKYVPTIYETPYFKKYNPDDLETIENVADWVNYINKPTETRARLNDLRERAFNKKVYNPLNEKITPAQYNKLLKLESTDNTGFGPLIQLKSVYSDDEIMNMLNTISKNENSDITSNNMYTAKNGGENINVGWLNKYADGGQKDNKLSAEEIKNISAYTDFLNGDLPFLNRLRADNTSSYIPANNNPINIVNTPGALLNRKGDQNVFNRGASFLEFQNRMNEAKPVSLNPRVSKQNDIIRSLPTNGKNYAIVDKKADSIFYFTPQGKNITGEPVITGASRNDIDKGLSMAEWMKQTGDQDHEHYFEYLKQNSLQTTPSGIFHLNSLRTDVAQDPNRAWRFINSAFRPDRARTVYENRIKDYGPRQLMYTFSDENNKPSSKAIHGTARQQRLDAFNNPNSDRALSNGCINVNGKSICFNALTPGSNLYVLPEKSDDYLYPQKKMDVNKFNPLNEYYENGGDTTDYNFPAWQLADPIRASYHVVNPKRFHGPDTYKYPNHMTFSNESMYSTPEHMGGTWTELKNGKWQFEPSQWNIQNAGGKENFLNLWKQTEGKQGNKVKFDYGGSFGSAFAKARKDLGAGKIFTWNGKQYTTNYAEETNTVDNSAPVRRYTAPIRKQELVDNNADMAAIAEQRMQYYNQQRKAVPPIPYPVPVNKSIVNNPFLNLAAPAQPQPFANLTPSYSNLTQFAYNPQDNKNILVKEQNKRVIPSNEKNVKLDFSNMTLSPAGFIPENPPVKGGSQFPLEMYINGIKRKINKLFGDDESSASKLDLTKVKANVPSKNIGYKKVITPAEFENTYATPTITGDTLWDDKNKGVYHMPMVVDLNQQSFGYRNRGDVSDVESPGYLFGAVDDPNNLRKFINAKTTKLNPDQFYSGVDPNTKKVRIQKGKWFQGKNIDVLPHQGFENVVSLAKDKQNKFVLQDASGAARNYWTPQYLRSDNTISGGPGLLIHKNQKDKGYYGSITGGNVILTTPDFKHQIYVSGSVNDINNAIEQFKKDTGSKTINAVTVDNGSYARNYLKANNKMSSVDWQSLDNRNEAGGLGYYMLPGKKDGGQIHNWREVEVPHKKNQLSGWLDKL